mmetsp:Transcript_3483/g.5433  ORF Transcript_3483/g.5433 Transcript_3483/m.5433 type:complete len:119 (-) Transcript_3483:1812-2168(-)
MVFTYESYGNSNSTCSPFVSANFQTSGGSSNNTHDNTHVHSTNTFKSPIKIMRGQELLTDFSRGDFDEWIDNIVSATIEHCTRNLADIVKCIRTQTDTTIQLDASKKPVATPIKDATG